MKPAGNCNSSYLIVPNLVSTVAECYALRNPLFLVEYLVQSLAENWFSSIHLTNAGTAALFFAILDALPFRVTDNACSVSDATFFLASSLEVERNCYALY